MEGKKRRKGRTESLVHDDVGEEESAEDEVAAMGEELENFLGVAAD
jgi:hypothetical protein